MKKRMTNVEMITELMEFSPFGAMSQLFIIDAVTKQAEAIAAMTDKEVKAMQKKSPMINIEAWRGAARDIQKRMDEFYKGEK